MCVSHVVYMCGCVCVCVCVCANNGWCGSTVGLVLCFGGVCASLMCVDCGHEAMLVACAVMQ